MILKIVFFFVKGPEEKRTHYISLVDVYSREQWDDVILFRDYMRNNKTSREEYTKLKKN